MEEKWRPELAQAAAEKPLPAAVKTRCTKPKMRDRSAEQLKAAWPDKPTPAPRLPRKNAAKLSAGVR